MDWERDYAGCWHEPERTGPLTLGTVRYVATLPLATDTIRPLPNTGDRRVLTHWAHGVVGEMAREFAAHERFWLAIAPEGTRKKVHKWKSGFWHIARAAKVPIIPIYFHYPEKTIGFGPLIHLTTDADADMARIREFYAPWQGKNRGTV